MGLIVSDASSAMVFSAIEAGPIFWVNSKAPGWASENMDGTAA
jgi:hypothetical protein